MFKWLSLFSPQVWAGIAIALLVLLSAAGWKGYNLGVDAQKGRDAAELAQVHAQLQTRDESLRSANAALKAVNDAADALLAQAAKDKAAEVAAQDIAAKAQAKLKRREASMAAQIAEARKHPTCAALLDTSVRRVCGL